MHLEENTGLKKVILSSEITSIDEYAFMYCTNLTSIKIPENVKSIGIQAFDSCASLSKVKVLATNATVGILTFRGLNSNAKIYVLNDTMKTRVEAEVTDSNATVEVVTEEQMKSL